MSEINKVRLFCSDLDGTLLGESEATARFVETWESMGGEDQVILVYSTGRLDKDAKRMIRLHGMPEPDFYITGVGTMIFETARGRMLDAYSEALNQGWDLTRVKEVVSRMPGIEAQPDVQQHAWKSSWFWHEKSADEIDGLRNSLSEAGLAAQVIYSTAMDLDVLPVAANKGNALRWLTSHLEVDLDEVIVAGDSGNDSSMFLLEGVRGIAPSNASPELLREIKQADAYHASESCASGVVEGLKKYGVTS